MIATAYEILQVKMMAEPKTWLITGVAGFIGSNLLETLLKLNQQVVGLDNFSTGYQYNLDDVQRVVSTEQWSGFQLIRGDIRNMDDCKKAAKDVDYVLHQAALGSVPHSIEDPITYNQNNIDGFLNMLVAARDAGVKRFVYASSSSAYGDHSGLPKVEDEIGEPLSPYSVTKRVNEIYANVFAKTYGFNAIGLRYFNIFGRRQDPEGAYAAVIPKWIDAMIQNQPVYINGDGETSRDFCYIDDAVQANLLAATVNSSLPQSEEKSMGEGTGPANQVYNVAAGDRTSLNELCALLCDNLAEGFPYLKDLKPIHQNFRVGDVRHSLADISKAQQFLGYAPTHRVSEGLKETMAWYVAQHP